MQPNTFPDNVGLLVNSCILAIVLVDHEKTYSIVGKIRFSRSKRRSISQKNRRVCETVETTAQSVVHLQLSATSHNVTCILLADFEERDLSQAGSQHRQS